MIDIIFPPGCYGTYLAKCLYNYTNLRQEPFVWFEFDNNGSSHDHRFNKESIKHIQIGHIDTLAPALDDIVITLLPDNYHNLDYYNNQFYKQKKGQLISYIKTNYTSEEIINKLNDHWGITATLDDNIPIWILREWCSFWIEDCWEAGYNRKKYSSISDLTVEVNELVESFDTVFIDLVSKLNLTLTVDLSIIQQTHFEFQQKQKFHNSQIRCINWVDSVIKNQLSVLTYSTIFDEAYIQKLLRDTGYEIYCDGLNKFPKVSTEMKELIYQV